MSRLNTLGVSMALLAQEMNGVPYANTHVINPFFNPTRSQRIKNKLNRKRYGRN